MHIQKIVLQCADPEALSSFYGETLGFSTDYGEDGSSLLVHAGKSELLFEKSLRQDAPFYHYAFNIPSNQIEDAYEWLDKRVEVLWLDDYQNYVADFESWHARSVYFLDPCSNILEMIARFDLNDVNQRPFSSNQVRNISEIGLVFENAEYDHQVADLLKKYPVHYFDKQEPREHFSAIGNDEGLLIAVGNQRNWYPTTTPSAIFPLQVHFEEKDESFLLQY